MISNLIDTHLAEFDNNFVDWNSPRFFADGKTPDDLKAFLKESMLMARAEVIEKVEAMSGIMSTAHSPLLGDGSGKHNQILFINLDDWIKLKDSLSNRKEGEA